MKRRTIRSISNAVIESGQLKVDIEQYTWKWDNENLDVVHVLGTVKYAK